MQDTRLVWRTSLPFESSSLLLPTTIQQSSKMMQKKTKLVDLPADVLLRILALCGVEDAVRIEMMCKFLRDVVATRHLWLTHLRGLPNECPPNLPPHVSLESLDCTGLKTLVVRAVRGGRNWNSLSPKVTREIKVIVKNPIRKRVLGVTNAIRKRVLVVTNAIRKRALVVTDATLVPGGDYLVVEWKTHLSLWDGYLQLLEVSNGEKIWLYPDPDYSCSVSRKLWAYGVDRISENVLRVATAETDYVEDKMSGFFFLSFRKQACTDIFVS
ncbi:hypothetical protein DFH11DRAFT_1086762 [Phellopilus nigrolimitatus]|nr:hypothetical protein DFH11DRAFT_1086762 [Phellopilus nigrolimitatus]